MLSLESAGVLLLVCCGVAAVVVGCSAALIFARSHLVPHGDCARRINSVELDLGVLSETVKHHSKTRAGRARTAKAEREEPETPEPEPENGMERIRNQLANSRSRLGG